MTTEQTALQRLKAVCEKAQVGEWHHGLEAMDVVEIYAESHSMERMSEYDDTSICVAEVGATPNASAIDNAAFIATARTALPALIAYCEVLEECLKGDPLVSTYEAIAIESARARLRKYARSNQLPDVQIWP